MKPLPLTGRTIALPETRELDIFARMLEERGATTLRCPLVAILDAPDPAPVEAWLHQFIAEQWDDLILLTGEGLRRLTGFAERAGIRQEFVARLSLVRKITRGPKPGKALRDLGLRADLLAAAPTTDGVIETLTGLDLRGREVGVQLYGSEPNLKLINYISEAGATPHPVAPYIYASKADAEKVITLIERMARGAIDVIAFTSAQQVTRMSDIARERGLDAQLKQGLERTRIAAVGPVVAQSLRDIGAQVAMMPEESYFMKPLVNEIVAALGNGVA